MFQPYRALIIFSVFIVLSNAQQGGDENCETLPFQLHLIKGDIFDIFIDFIINLIFNLLRGI